ncbi:MAG: UDP-N-acetylmuramate--L-alanine ligase, partial [Bacteroidia bacterium]|nr:UDP-N-acetylmuramate--L-alanine ligase [Bacteroidia bacterium]
IVVVEADEYDRSFLTLFPEIAVITSADADHLDIYGDVSYVEESFSMFANQVNSKLILKKSIESKIKTNKQYITYSVDDTAANYYATNIVIKDGQYHYEIHTPKGLFKNMTLGLPGKHNVENSIAAVAIACEMGVKEDVVRFALESFKGVKRRFDYQIKTNDLIFIDDYAHHPEELKATIESAKALFPNKKITGIFQPHLYSRTRDFAKEFALSLDLLDECILMEIYPARELPIEGVSSKMLIDMMKSGNKLVCSKTELISELSKRKIEVLLTMGAGDIDMLVEPIKNAIS